MAVTLHKQKQAIHDIPIWLTSHKFHKVKKKEGNYSCAFEALNSVKKKTKNNKLLKISLA